MAQVINTNSLSLLTQNNLNKSQSALGSAIERLSSGLRINSAKDDAAGQAIANRFTSNIKGLTQASRNANDGISIAQTTEGSLSEINNNLQRVRELAVQAQNSTNSKSDLKSIQDEIKQRLDEIDRVSNQTQFNGVKVLASNSSLKIQVGANDGEAITIDLKEINSKTLGLDKLDVSNTFVTSDLQDTALTELSAGKVSVKDLDFTDTAGAAAYKVYVQKADPNKIFVGTGTGATAKFYEATYDEKTNSFKFSSAASVGKEADYSDATGKDVHVGGGRAIAADSIKGRTDTNDATKPTLHLDEKGAYHVSFDKGTTFRTATVADGKVSYTSADVPAALATGSKATAALKEIGTPSAPVAIDMTGVTDVDGAQLFARKDGNGYVIKGTVDGKVSYFKADVAADGKVTKGDHLSEDPLANLDSALATVDKFRSSLGAIQNRFDSAIKNLGNTVNNLSSARSRIEDADYATEVSNMSRAQILQQAGTSVLAQANQVTQNVLSLLR
ncbi:flagellin FliC [Salmonella enterica subsp. diarizonae serovar 16:z10:e,n,x,z15]|uniref:flagellin N-terminal helical domain-containing protein n=1 Tax=Salmonella enterica TaxID=28901 RepID=UPI001F115BF6|nr:flagellin FliC [Salmonella enterica subsp. diarizonae]MCH5482532.1 flagellin FliC [Salmonella enterica subsp. diarizonae serovar 16:z10:e,n,x,z15]